MSYQHRATAGCFAVSLLSFCVSSHALTIDLQFPSGYMFSSTPSVETTARNAISEAASDLSSAITTTLNAISTDTYTGISGATTATFNWAFQYRDPATNNVVSIDNATIALDAVSIFVDARSLLGTTLGLGGPGNIDLAGGFSGGGQESQWVAAVNSGANQSENAYERGAGPHIGTYTGSITLGSVTANFSVDNGVSYGSLAFDNDSNNNGSRNTDSQLANYWHYDHTSPVLAGKRDLYSIALHELLHVLGMGTSSSWTSQVSGSTWFGPEVTAITISGADLVDGESGHITAGTRSTRISDGTEQEVVMDPNILIGTRKELTVLDLAFLRDIGWDTIIPSLPADYDADGDVDGDDRAHWETWFAINDNADSDSDNDSDGTDFLTLQRWFTGSLPLAAGIAVPEPGAAVLILLGLTGFGFYAASSGRR